MIERRNLGHLAREPLYNTRAVAQTTAVPADTFRAWERRYGIPRPYRTSGNQRLYSERDIGIIVWLRDRTAEGMTISQAIQRLKIEHPGALAERAPAPLPAVTPPVPEPQLARLRERLIEAIVEFDDLAGERVLDEGLALFSIEEFCTRLVVPVLYEVGERWSRDELPVTAEHFATRLITRRLSMIFNLVAPPSGRGTIVAACAPGEEHEAGLLILAIFLARRNRRVIYLGANVPSSDLIATIRRIGPDLVCLSASMPPAAERALNVADEILSRVSPPPAVVLGGRAFEQHRSPQTVVGAHVLTGDLYEVVDQVGEISERRKPAPAARDLPPS